MVTKQDHLRMQRCSPNMHTKHVILTTSPGTNSDSETACMHISTITN